MGLDMNEHLRANERIMEKAIDIIGRPIGPSVDVDKVKKALEMQASFIDRIINVLASHGIQIDISDIVDQYKPE